MAEKLGAKHILNDKANYQDIARITGGQFFSAPLNKGIVTGGFDIVYDCVATPQTTTDALRWTRANGTVVMVGLHLNPCKSGSVVGLVSPGQPDWRTCMVRITGTAGVSYLMGSGYSGKSARKPDHHVFV
jgi:threonine dehydrogenase-like Zn-dependent dehydrogenase